MIVSFNIRENHYKGKEVMRWYETLPKTERSRKIIDVLYAHILSNEHSINYPYSSGLYNARGGSEW